MYARVVPAVLEKYGITYITIGEAQKGYRNESYPIYLAGGGVINLIFFKREPRIKERIARADTTADCAAKNGLPVRIRYDTRIMQVAANTYAGLYLYMPGKTISWEGYEMKHIKLLGQAMGDLHAALRDMPKPVGPTVNDELVELYERMERYFDDKDVKRAMLQKLGVTIDPRRIHFLRQFVESNKHLPAQQMLHMDMVRGNVLFENAKPSDRWQIKDVALTGIIDFEKAAYGHPICDVARTLAFLYVDCPKSTDKIFKYFFQSGYVKRGVNTLTNGNLLGDFILLFLMHDFYKFLRHTPYESLADNYHYIRTRDLLKSYGMISLKN